jgi:monoamine oxidase
VDVVLFEAQERVGGRTFSTEVAGAIVDEGGQFVGPTQTAILEVARSVGVDVVDVAQRGDGLMQLGGDVLRYAEGSPLDHDSLVANMKLLAEADERARPIDPERPWAAPEAEQLDRTTVEQWLQAGAANERGRFLPRLLGETISCAPQSELSLLAFLTWIAAARGWRPLLVDAQDMRLLGGAQTISRRLALELGQIVRCGSPVLRVVPSVEEASIVTASGESVRARRVIVALPVHLTGEMGGGTVRRQLAQRVPMGSVVKFAAVFERPWWRNQGLDGRFAGDGDLAYGFDVSPPDCNRGVLIGFALASSARRLGRLSEGERNRVLLEHLATLFGPKAARPMGMVSKDWASDPWSGGAYSGVYGPGVLTGFREAIRAPAGPVHWAGTETSSVWPGYMDGAVRSGLRAAEEVRVGLGVR